MVEIIHNFPIESFLEKRKLLLRAPFHWSFILSLLVLLSVVVQPTLVLTSRAARGVVAFSAVCIQNPEYTRVSRYVLFLLCLTARLAIFQGSRSIYGIFER